MISYPLAFLLQLPFTFLDLLRPSSLTTQPLSLISVPLHLSLFFNNKGSSFAGQQVSSGGFDGRGGTYAAEELPRGRIRLEGVWVSRLPSFPSL
jgi:hypothetical protein